jgi:hypothetical protein
MRFSETTCGSSVTGCIWWYTGAFQPGLSVPVWEGLRTPFSLSLLWLVGLIFVSPL